MQIAPPATPLQDFTYHWKQLVNFYASHETDCKLPIENTGIRKHLDRLLDILLEEEKNSDETGACLEYLLQHGLLDWITTLAIVETPPGMRLVCLSFLKKILARSKHPLLHHSAVHGPVQRLISQCNGNYASPIEAEEIQFLLTLCFLVCKYPHLTSIVSDCGNVRLEPQLERGDTERMNIQSVTYAPTRKRNNSNPLFEPLNTQAVTLINPNLFANERQRRRSNCSEQLFDKAINDLRKSVRKNDGKMSKHRREDTLRRSNESNSSKDTENLSHRSSPLSQQPVEDTTTCENTCYVQEYEHPDKESHRMNSVDDDVDGKLQELEDLRVVEDYRTQDSMSEIDEKAQNLSPQSSGTGKSSSLLLDALISYLNSAVSIEDSKLACDTGGHFINYPTWPLPRTNPNVDVLNNSLNYYALADLMLYRLCVNIKHITLCLQTF